VTHLRETQVQNTEHHHNSQHRQSHSAIERKAEGTKHYDFERAEMGEILRAPFGDGRQGCTQHYRRECHQDHFGAVGIEASGAHGKQGE